ncbi:MAG: hypothetical protein DIU63_12535 [Proteobacteria bacterium]|nr:MAG: hypothetical protein DIU63_12535 [Pseudomonadota bacterium]
MISEAGFAFQLRSGVQPSVAQITASQQNARRSPITLTASKSSATTRPRIGSGGETMSLPSKASSDYALSTNNNARHEPFGRTLLKRAALGVILLIIIVSSGAWLMHNGIEAGAEPAFTEEVAISQSADRAR